MSWVLDWAVWGFVSTLVLTALLEGSQLLRLTRMNLPFLLGTMLTADRDRAKLYGLGLHLLNGLLFSGVYVAAFAAWGRASWWLGGLMGVLHAGFLLLVVLPALPALHPRMASESQSPTEVKQLEPPGVLGLHYGMRTPLTALVSHVVFGVLLGSLFRV
ncbi:hypothetical protein [Vitiosangium sp. GDMCC 1.1324]|uniref:hypothetical protein n=1 Tax=Vitiosangium sp. (strain GDMCC 1.1324) TaxID=2138576 RepID=UPI000D377AF6|nr:hypothetical protein [Vitiosangium sp. GDMCC 1.1324]PTL78786.1 hypothetical protein DAT35_37630 [Vitiosangium sp. GDMCC 1.1324]